MKQIETDIFNYRSKEFYINLDKKDIPVKPEDPYKIDKDFDDFFDWEEDKCKNGLTINGVYIAGGLYYHLNWHTIVEEVERASGRIEYEKAHPQLWDNVWKIFTEYENAQKQQGGKQIFMLAGSRQISKTTTLVSMASREAFVFENSETLGLFSTAKDRKNFTKKFVQAANDKENIFVKELLDKDMGKGEIRIGAKEKDNTLIPFSSMFLNLTEEGNNSQVGAGYTPTFYFFDEFAKAGNKAAHEAVLPALRGKFGLRTSPLLVFTGGSISDSTEAKNMYMNPVANNVRPYRNGSKDTGFFLDATHRQDFKHLTTFAKYLGVKKGSELDIIPIHTSNVELALKTLAEEKKLAEQDADSRTAIIKRIYDPLVVEDMFMREGGNPFSAFRAKLEKHKEFLLQNKVGRNVEVSIQGGVASWKDTNKKAIVNFPKLDYEDTDAAIVMYDPPKASNTYYLHAGGLDPYNTGKTETSPSLGSFYLMRRRNHDISDPYQDTMVVSYCSRPEKMPIFLNNIKAILMLYNATMLHERSNDIVLHHFDVNNEAQRYLCESWNLAHEINPQSEAKSGYGLATTTKNKEFCIAQTVDYLGEVIDIVNGEEILGLARILDPLLIDEFLDYDVEGNFDRVLGFGHAVAYCKYLDKFYKVEEERKQETKKQNNDYRKSPFSFGGKSPFAFGR